MSDKIFSVLGQGQGQRGGGQQQQQRKQQLIGLIMSYTGKVPLTSNILQLEKTLQQAQRIHKLKEIIPLTQEDTIIYLISKGLNDDQIVKIGSNFTEEDINFMIACNPKVENKQIFLNSVIFHTVEKVKPILKNNKTKVQDLNKRTGLSRDDIIRLLKAGITDEEILEMGGGPKKKSKVTPPQQQVKTPLDGKILKYLQSKGMNAQQILRFGQNFNTYFPQEERQTTLQYLRKMDPSVHNIQDLIDILLKIRSEGFKVFKGFKEFIQTVRSISEITGKKPVDIVALLEKGIRAQEIIDQFSSSTDAGTSTPKSTFRSTSAQGRKQIQRETMNSIRQKHNIRVNDFPSDFNLQLQREIHGDSNRKAFSEYLADKPWQQEKDWKTKYKKYTGPYQLSKGIIQNGSLPLKYIFWEKYKRYKQGVGGGGGRQHQRSGGGGGGGKMGSE